MSLRAVIEIALHFESFRNIDLFHQGLYHLKARLRQDGGSSGSGSGGTATGSPSVNTQQPSQQQASEWGTSAEGVPMLKATEHIMSSGRKCFKVESRYSFGLDRISVDLSVESYEHVRGLLTLPRVGLKLLAAPRLSRLAWLGCGPGESYPDRKSASDWAVHCGDVDDQHVDYMVPSECGGKADVHGAALTDPDANEGILMEYACLQAAPPEERPEDQPSTNRPSGTRGAQLSASRWTMQELDAHRHIYELRSFLSPAALKERPVQVHLDTAHAGVGAAGQGGDKLWATAKQFMVNPKESWQYTVHLRPISGAMWAHSGNGSV
mmetsp:Transcript_62626/g.173285  ORF Transcript_62626/g.173285 Transcript_62626/m.173285 type:complete len:323 (-) Transcript_62626:138-1106(-)